MWNTQKHVVITSVSLKGVIFAERKPETSQINHIITWNVVT